MTFSLTILGNSSAIPTSKRFPTAHVLNVREQLFLIDCGEGTQIQLRRFRIKFAKIKHIFISHLHGDHYYGIFGLLSSYNLLHRKIDLHIYAPPELEKILTNKYSPVQIEQLGFKIIFHNQEAKHKIIYEDKNIIIESFSLKHRIPTWGFVFKERQKPANIIKEKITQYNLSIADIVKIKYGADFIDENNEIILNKNLTFPPKKPRSYAFCSDTIYDETIIPYIKNIDLLYHEATFEKKDEEQAKHTLHTTSEQAAQIAQKANVGKLVIGHFSARYKNLSILVEQARNIFENTICAEDGLVIKVSEKKRLKNN